LNQIIDLFAGEIINNQMIQSPLVVRAILNSTHCDDNYTTQFCH